jgi:hypothetical protein
MDEKKKGEGEMQEVSEDGGRLLLVDVASRMLRW